jgi:uncharacterized OB-fold protein/acyl dehydratase
MSNPAQAKAELESRLREFIGQQTGPPSTAPDPVNEAMIHHWCDAMGDALPVYRDPAAARDSVHGGVVAPPTMMQAWILRGMRMADAGADEGSRDLQNRLHELLTESGYPSVVATNCEQEYHRYLRPGDRVEATTVIESISEQKATALGIGYFIDTRTTFRVDGEEVGWMTFRVLKFKPDAPPAAAADAGEDASPAAPRRLRPTLGHDNRWWWEAVAEGRFLIQRCKACGVLRHPPRPMCGECRSLEWDTVETSGAGTVHSFVVIHHPPVPGYEYPLVCALIDLEGGTRFVSNVIDCDPREVHIGMKVQASIEAVDDEMSLPLFRPVR